MIRSAADGAFPDEPLHQPPARDTYIDGIFTPNPAVLS